MAFFNAFSSSLAIFFFRRFSSRDPLRGELPPDELEDDEEEEEDDEEEEEEEEVLIFMGGTGEFDEEEVEEFCAEE